MRRSVFQQNGIMNENPKKTDIDCGYQQENGLMNKPIIPQQQQHVHQINDIPIEHVIASPEMSNLIQLISQPENNKSHLNFQQHQSNSQNKLETLFAGNGLQSNNESMVSSQKKYIVGSRNNNESMMLSNSSNSENCGITKDSQKKSRMCNCKKTKCLKLYCDCFAMGELCGSECKCSECCNNQINLNFRNEAIENILERNPFAFDVKPEEPKKLKKDINQPPKNIIGCNCRKSNCLKKYCLCFQSGLKCSESCKCIECKNIDQGNNISQFQGGKEILKVYASEEDGETQEHSQQQMTNDYNDFVINALQQLTQGIHINNFNYSHYENHHNDKDNSIIHINNCNKKIKSNTSPQEKQQTISRNKLFLNYSCQTAPINQGGVSLSKQQYSTNHINNLFSLIQNISDDNIP